jgi:hypothetical protein
VLGQPLKSSNLLSSATPEQCTTEVRFVNST